MADELYIPITTDRQERYEALLPQIKSLIQDEPDLVANMANITAALRDILGFFWVGFYVVKKDDLVLGPFQGPVACTRIQKGKGVCGSSWEQAATIIVPDVVQFPGHIVCSTSAQSEIVIPGFKNGKVFLVLDVDSNRLDDFDAIDQNYLEQLMRLLEVKF